MTSWSTALVIGIIISLVGIVAGGRYLIQQRLNQRGVIVVPERSTESARGEVAFAAYCVSCHGKSAAGTDKGPSLINQIYSTTHHGDFSFVRAVTNRRTPTSLVLWQHACTAAGGAAKMDEMIVYLRDLQKANGIR